MLNCKGVILKFQTGSWTFRPFEPARMTFAEGATRAKFYYHRKMKEKAKKILRKKKKSPDSQSSPLEQLSILNLCLPPPFSLYSRMAEPRFNSPYFWPPPPAMAVTQVSVSSLLAFLNFPEEKYVMRCFCIHQCIEISVYSCCVTWQRVHRIQSGVVQEKKRLCILFKRDYF